MIDVIYLESGSDKEIKNTKKVRMKNNEYSSIIVDVAARSGEGCFKSLKDPPA